jgi:hypothetical protein
MVQSAITPNPATITGGTVYIITISTDAAQYVRGKTGGIKFKRFEADYTDTGFPADLGIDGDTEVEEFCVRCGVEAAAGGSIVPLAMHHYKQQGTH